MKLYCFPEGVCPNANRAEFCLLLKGIPYEKIVLDHKKMEHKSESFLKVNPRGQVPCLIDGDGEIIVVESYAIVEYLEKFYPQPPLMPKDQKSYAEALVRFHQVPNKLLEKTSAVIYPAMFHSKKKEDLSTEIEKLLVEMKEWDSYLNDGRPYFAGSEISLADITVLPIFIQLNAMGFHWKSFQNLGGFYERMRNHEILSKFWPPYYEKESTKVNFF